MDVRMPNVDGIEATRALLADDKPPRVLMLTTFDIDEYVYEAIRAGASGFLLKDALPDELIAAVHVIARGDSLLAPSVTRRMIEHFVSASPVRATFLPSSGSSHPASARCSCRSRADCRTSRSRTRWSSPSRP